MKRINVVNFLVKIMTILIIGTTATFSWFVNYDTIEPIGGDITVGVDPMSAISLDVTNIVVEDFKFTGECVSSNGNKFYGIDTSQSGRDIIGYHEIEIGSDEYNQSVFEAQIAFTSYQKLVLYLGSRSSVTPYNEGNGGWDSLDDYIGGAIRVAFLHEYIDENNQEKVDRLVWAPNMNYRYNAQTNQASIGGTVEDSIKFLSKTLEGYQTNSIITHGLANGYDMDAKTIWGIPAEDVHRNIPLFSINNNEQTQTVIKVRIWVEGTDREAHKNLMGGIFNMHLHFVILNENDN